MGEAVGWTAGVTGEAEGFAEGDALVVGAGVCVPAGAVGDCVVAGVELEVGVVAGVSSGSGVATNGGGGT